MNAALDHAEAIRDERGVCERSVCRGIRAGAVEIREGRRLVDEYAVRQVD